jgi:hypothetical protein
LRSVAVPAKAADYFSKSLRGHLPSLAPPGSRRRAPR